MATAQGEMRPAPPTLGDAAADNSDGPELNGEQSKVESVVKKWLVYEDGVIANQIQQDEIRRHYGFNRQTRQTVRSDIPVAKELQSGEEFEAALARQRHHDALQRRTEHDEMLAREIADREQARLRRRHQAALSADATSAPPSAAVRVPPPQAAQVPAVPPTRTAAVTAAPESRHGPAGPLTDEELARRIQADEQERYLRRQAEMARRRSTGPDVRRQPRPRSDGARLAAAAAVPAAAVGGGSSRQLGAAAASAVEDRLRSPPDRHQRGIIPTDDRGADRNQRGIVPTDDRGVDRNQRSIVPADDRGTDRNQRGIVPADDRGADRSSSARAAGRGPADANGGSSSGGSGGSRSSGSGGRATGPSSRQEQQQHQLQAGAGPSLSQPPPFVRANPRVDVSSRRLSGGAELASRLGRHSERPVRLPQEDRGDFGDFCLPPGPEMSEDECRQLQEEQDAEIARLLQAQEHKRTGGGERNSSSKVKEQEQHDAELARVLQDEERVRAQMRAIKQRQRALQQAKDGGVVVRRPLPQQQQLIASERTSAGDLIAGTGRPLSEHRGGSSGGGGGGNAAPVNGRQQQQQLANGSRPRYQQQQQQPPRAIPSAAASDRLPGSRAGGEVEGVYDSPWDITHVEDQLMRLRASEGVPLQPGAGAAPEEVRLRSGDRSGNSGHNIAESIDPTYKRRSRDFQKRLSGDFGPQSRPPLDFIPPAPTEPAPPPPSSSSSSSVSAQRPAAMPSSVEPAKPNDWAPVPGQRRSQRKSKKGGGCKQQ